MNITVPSLIGYDSIVTTTLDHPLTNEELASATWNGSRPLHCLTYISLENIADATEIACANIFGDMVEGGKDWRLWLVGVVDDFDLARVRSPMKGVGIFMVFVGDVSEVLENV